MRKKDGVTFVCPEYSKKSLFLGLLVALLLLMVPATGFAAAPTEGAPLVEESDQFFEDLVTPQYIPCDYWSDKAHRYQTGKTDYKYVFVTKHPHMINGVTFNNCEISKVYRIVDKYCACGMTTQQETYSHDAHSVN